LAVLQTIPQLPDSSGWGVHVLTVARAPDEAIWVGTYGQGIFVLRPGAASWQRIHSSPDTAAHAISWDFVHAFGFGLYGEVWYGTVGNGWGLSIDGGRTWKNWEFGQLGPEWQYVAPNGIVTRGDTTYIGTADGIKLTWDNGATWHVITDAAGATTAKDPVWGRLKNQYVISLSPSFYGLSVTNLGGLSLSDNGGRKWTYVKISRNWRPGADTLLMRQFRLARAQGTALGFCADSNIFPIVLLFDDSTRGTPWGIVYGHPKGRCLGLPGAPATVTSAAQPESLRHTWFKRPIALTDQPFIDQTYRFGSTMGGNFQPHQGVEFNNPDGTPVHAIGDGVIVHSGPAERGALTVAIKHDRRLPVAPGRGPGAHDPYYLYSVYYHNSKLLRQVGDRVKAGDVIALVGNTGRATNDHLHLEVHASPFDSTRLIVDSAVRYPPYNTNPELWIEPLPGTGVIAGQAWDSAGQPVSQTRIYGLLKPEPKETPFSYVETYGPKNHSDPVYREHFAISDVPPGEYVLGTDIGGKRIFRRVRVEPGKLTWVEFKP